MEDVMSEKYVDAYVMPVPKSKVEGYKTFSKKIGDFLKKHGALEYVDCVADDVSPANKHRSPKPYSWATTRPSCCHGRSTSHGKTATGR
jgi:hypothetical protein